MEAIESQKLAILDELLNGKKLTVFDGYEMFRSMKLSTRVSDIRKMGYPVNCEMIQGTNTYGRKICYGEYSFPKEYLEELKKQKEGERYGQTNYFK
jgi:hypothetical protein